MFVNAEQVAGPTGLFDDAYARCERTAAEAGATAEEWDASVQRMARDRTATVERQLGWLRQAGSADADCLSKDHSFAVLVARRAGQIRALRSDQAPRRTAISASSTLVVTTPTR